MEAAVEVSLPASVDSAKLMGSPEGFGIGGVVVGEVRWQTDGACSTGGKNDDINAANYSAWCPKPVLGLDVKPVLPKSGKTRKSNGCNNRSGMTHMDVSKAKPGSYDVKNGTFSHLVSLTASCNELEKNHGAKQKNNFAASRRGDRRNSKANCKSRSDSFSLKNSLVGFNSAAGGNHFIGLGVLKPDALDITKHVDEPSLEELLSGSYSGSLIKDEVKTTSNSNSNLLQSVRNAYSVIRARKVSPVQISSEIGEDLVRKDSASSDAVSSSLGQTNDNKSSEKKSDDKAETFNTADYTLYKPRDVLERLTLPIPKDLDALLSDASKTASMPKISPDARLSKTDSPRTGPPPFPWSHSFSGHNHKLGSDTLKLSTSRTMCQGRWARVTNRKTRQKSDIDLLENFELLEFDRSLVPVVYVCSENKTARVETGSASSPATTENKAARVETGSGSSPTTTENKAARVETGSGSSPTTTVTANEYSTDAAAQTLLHMAACSNSNPLQTPLHMKAMKAGMSKSAARPETFFQSPISPHNPLKAHENGFSSKKPRLSTDLPNSACIAHHDESSRRGLSSVVDPSSLVPVNSCELKMRKLPK